MPPKKIAAEPQENEDIIVADPVEEAPEPEGIADNVGETLESLKEQLAAEQERRVAAETRNNELAEREVGARTEVQSSNLNLVTNAIGMLTQAQDVLEGNLTQALADQDHATAASIQRQMMENSAKLLRLEEGKRELEAAPAPVREAPSDPVEKLASQLTPRSADWVRRHPEYATNDRLYQKMLGAHNLAVGDGFAADSDAYFEAVEGHLGLRKAEPNGADPVSEAARPRQAPPAAPVSRGNGSANVVTLSAEEREIAQLSGQTPEEYAQNKLALQKAGKLN